MRRHGLVLFSILLTGCAGDRAPASLSTPVVFIGVDSADWTWIDPLLEQGRMPRLGALVDGGARGPLRSLVPPQKSPTIWTSIATGKRPAKHGIADFITHEERVQTSEMRSAAAYWEILGQLGQVQAVLGWWVTYPAPRVNGVLVSDFLPYVSTVDREGENAVYPPQEWPALAPLVVRPDALEDELLGRFVDLSLVREHGEEGDRLLADLREFVAGDLTYLAIARALLERGGWDVFTVYFRGLDMACHSYWRWFEPRHSGLAEDDWRVRAFGRVVEAYYLFVDELIGRVLDASPAGARIVLVSDHGFVGHRRERGTLSVGVGMHRDDGILVLHGPGIRRGVEIEGAEVKDVMPTLLAMRNAPLAEDLDGQLIGAAFESRERAHFDRLLEQMVPTYEGIVEREGRRSGVSDEVNEAVKERLRSLGYID